MNRTMVTKLGRGFDKPEVTVYFDRVCVSMIMDMLIGQAGSYVVSYYQDSTSDAKAAGERLPNPEVVEHAHSFVMYADERPTSPKTCKNCGENPEEVEGEVHVS